MEVSGCPSSSVFCGGRGSREERSEEPTVPCSVLGSAAQPRVLTVETEQENLTNTDPLPYINVTQAAQLPAVWKHFLLF